VGRFEIVHMKPRIGAVLDASFGGQRLMGCSVIFVIRFIVKNTWPQESSSAFRHDRDVQFVKVGAPAGLDII
jgi:hypothetical protein